MAAPPPLSDGAGGRGAERGSLVGEVLIVAALVLGTGAGDKSPPSSSVSAIVPQRVLLPPPAKSNSSLVPPDTPSSPILGLELLLCTEDLLFPPSDPTRSGLSKSVMSAKVMSVSWLGWLLSNPFCTLATQLVTPLGLLTRTSHHP